MFVYDEELGNTRTWRPDLVPAILWWLGGIPPECLTYLARLGISDLGGFIAVFRFRRKEISFEFDRLDAMVIHSPGHNGIWRAGHIVPFAPQQLEQVSSAVG